jgi:hypothetical protein
MSTPVLPTGNDQALRDLALKRIKNRRDFQGHLVVYVVVNLFLWGLWVVTSGLGSYPWPAWVTLGWGIGVVMNWWGVTRRPITREELNHEIRRLQ